MLLGAAGADGRSGNDQQKSTTVGKNGSEGKTGQSGLNGQKVSFSLMSIPGEISFAVSGRTRGANARAVDVNNLLPLFDSMVQIDLISRGGKGGDGGNGGRGGDGGDGKPGKNATKSQSGTDGTDGHDGGGGGDGLFFVVVARAGRIWLTLFSFFLTRLLFLS